MNWSGQASKHEADHSETNEGGDGSSVALEVADETTVVADPGEGALDDPAFGKNDEAMQFTALDDLDPPRASPCSRGGGLRALIAGVGEDTLDEREQPAGATVENQPCAVAILDAGRMNDNVQQEAERVDEDMPLAARDLFARIEALRVKRRPPF